MNDTKHHRPKTNQHKSETSIAIATLHVLVAFEILIIYGRSLNIQRYDCPGFGVEPRFTF